MSPEEIRSAGQWAWRSYHANPTPAGHTAATCAEAILTGIAALAERLDQLLERLPAPPS